MFPLTLALVDFLCTPEAQAALADLAPEDLSEAQRLALLQRLRRRFPPEQAAALLDQARLRRKAAAKFPQPERLLFTEEALQQASSCEVARYRAAQVAAYLGGSAGAAPGRLPVVADLGCGIGADTVALAEVGLSVLAVERDPVRARIAGHNAASLGLADRVHVLQADWTTLPWGEPGWVGQAVAVAFADPSRRCGQRRIFRLAETDPPPEAVARLRERLPDVLVKTLPGLADEEIPEGAEVEFISEEGEMKEALLRFGRLRRGAERTATLLPGPHHLDNSEAPHPPPLSAPLAHLYEPDPAVLRATLVQHLAARLQAAQLDRTVAYLTAEHPVETPFARRWQVVRHGPFHLKTLKGWLRELDAGEVVIKKRGSAVDVAELGARLKPLRGTQAFTLFLTRVAGQPWMVVGSA